MYMNHYSCPENNMKKTFSIEWYNAMKHKANSSDATLRLTGIPIGRVWVGTLLVESGLGLPLTSEFIKTTF